MQHPVLSTAPPRYQGQAVPAGAVTSSLVPPALWSLTFFCVVTVGTWGCRGPCRGALAHPGVGAVLGWGLRGRSPPLPCTNPPCSPAQPSMPCTTSARCPSPSTSWTVSDHPLCPPLSSVCPPLSPLCVPAPQAELEPLCLSPPAAPWGHPLLPNQWGSARSPGAAPSWGGSRSSFVPQI